MLFSLYTVYVRYLIQFGCNFIIAIKAFHCSRQIKDDDSYVFTRILSFYSNYSIIWEPHMILKHVTGNIVSHKKLSDVSRETLSYIWPTNVLQKSLTVMRDSQNSRKVKRGRCSVGRYATHDCTPISIFLSTSAINTRKGMVKVVAAAAGVTKTSTNPPYPSSSTTQVGGIKHFTWSDGEIPSLQSRPNMEKAEETKNFLK